MKVPFNDLSRRAQLHHTELVGVVERVIGSGWYILGPEVKNFEEAFARYVGAQYAIGVGSGTDAIALALRAVGVGLGDEVITVANTATATVAAIRMTGATPVFADILEDFTLDPKDFKRRITNKTKAVVPVHLYGFPADMKAICKVADAHGIAVLEDCAQAHGATVDGVPVGTFGHAAAFSFYPTKNLGAFGDGGAIVTGDASVAERLVRMRAYGERAKYDSVEEGVNSRLDELQAALLSWGLEHIQDWNARRRAIAERYRKGITNSAVVLPSEEGGGRSGVWHLFVVRVKDRAHFMKYLESKGIGTAIHYPSPIYRMDAYKFLGVNPADYPTTERIVPEIVSLPMMPELMDEEVDTVIKAVEAYRLAS